MRTYSLVRKFFLRLAIEFVKTATVIDMAFLSSAATYFVLNEATEMASSVARNTTNFLSSVIQSGYRAIKNGIRAPVEPVLIQ